MSLSVDRHQPRCGRCGAPTQPQTIKGMSALVCVSCGAVTVDQQTLHRLTGALPTPGRTGPQPVMLDGSGQPSTFPSGGGYPGAASQPTPGGAGWSQGPTPFGINPSSEPSFGEPHAPLLQSPARARSRRPLLALLAALVVFALILAAPVSYLVYLGIAAYTESQAVAVAPRPVALVPATATVTVEEPEADAEPEEEVVEVEPEPAPAPQPVGFEGLLQRGWGQVEANPSAAARTFQAALDQRPTHPEANYGLGYARLKQGDPAGAQPWLCAAQGGDDPEVVRDVRSLLAQNGLTCQ